jgi:hypothetical protein
MGLSNQTEVLGRKSVVSGAEPGRERFIHFRVRVIASDVDAHSYATNCIWPNGDSL